MSKNYNLEFSRQELKWLHRQMINGRDKAEAIIKTYTGPLSEDKTAELNEHQKFFDELNALAVMFGDALAQGDKERLQVHDIRAELNEVMELNPEQAVEIRKRLEALPKDKSYKIAFDRGTLKFTVKLIENDLLRYKTKVIPKYEQSDEKDYTDVVFNKTYYINKARSEKDILERLKIRLEKAL